MREEFGISSNNYLLYRTFIGDKSDNIPGLKGVGLKSLLKHFPIITQDEDISVDQIVEFAESVDKKYKVHENVISNKNILQLNYQLMQLKEEAESKGDFDKIKEIDAELFQMKS